MLDSNDNDIPDITLGTGNAGANVTDAAIINVTGVNEWDGTMSFFLCGPIPVGELCDGSTDHVGVPMGSAVIDETSDQPIFSDVANLTEVGYYCWRGEFDSETNGVDDAEDASAGECFEVLPVTPTISTNALSGPVTLGTALDDTATLTGTANQPGGNGPGDADGNFTSINADNGAEAAGTITFTAYGPHEEIDTCDTEAYSSVVDLNDGGDGDYTASDGDGGTFIPDSAGTYNWIAVYSGDPSNAPLNTLGVSGACGDPNESGSVGPKQPAITTTALSGPVTLGGVIYDDAHLTGTALQEDGTTPAGGTITFNLYGPDDTDCSGPIVFTDDVDVSGDDTYRSAEFTPIEVGTYRWIASYSGDPPNTLGVSGACNDDNEASVISPVQPAITTTALSGPVTLGGVIYDDAHLTGTALRRTAPPPRVAPSPSTCTVRTTPTAPARSSSPTTST